MLSVFSRWTNPRFGCIWKDSTPRELSECSAWRAFTKTPVLHQSGRRLRANDMSLQFHLKSPLSCPIARLWTSTCFGRGRLLCWLLSGSILDAGMKWKITALVHAHCTWRKPISLYGLIKQLRYALLQCFLWGFLQNLCQTQCLNRISCEHPNKGCLLPKNIKQKHGERTQTPRPTLSPLRAQALRVSWAAWERRHPPAPPARPAAPVGQASKLCKWMDSKIEWMLELKSSKTNVIIWHACWDATKQRK